MRNRDPKKKQKGQETTIGKIIYGFLLFLPLFAIGVTCGYAIFNKNAYQSYSSKQSPNTYLSEDAVTSLQEDKIYQFTTDNQFYLASSVTVNVNEIVVIKSVSGYTGLNKTPISFAQYTNQNGYFIHIIYSNNTHDYLKYANTDYSYIGTIQFNFVSSNDTSTYAYTNWTKEIIFGTQQSLDNVFYYSIDKVQQSTLFNWAENSIIYTTTASTCTALSITTPFIPLLMSYWLIISVIYFLYDIALMLVWIIHRKIHELQESI